MQRGANPPFIGAPEPIAAFTRNRVPADREGSSHFRDTPVLPVSTRFAVTIF